MEIREVKIEEYWPLIVKGTAEFGQIAAALNPEFNKLAECIYRVLNESFIQDASEYGVSRWESILGITPAAGATLDDRKAAILTYMNIKLPYTWRVLKQMLVPILGGEDKFVMEYVNDEGKLVLHTDRLDDAMLATVDELLTRVLPQNAEVERYNHNMEISWRDINKYAECTNISELYAVAPDKHGSEIHFGVTIWHTLDLTSDGNFIYPLPKLEKLDVGFGSSYFQIVTAELFKISLPSLTGNNARLFQGVLAKTIECDLPLVTGFSAGYCHDLRRFVGNTPNVTNWNSVFISCGWRHNESLDIDCDFSKATTATDMATSCKLNKASVLRVCVGEKSIPAYTSGTHNITLGIHVDHQSDEEVLAAIAEAENKGWTLTVQWNGTPTSGVSSTDLEEIYVKVTESEYGEYTDENGNRCMLEWGHYVTDTTDYKLFFSLVEAEQYFKLTKVNENE